MQTHTEFREIPANFTAKNTAKFRGIPYIFQKIPYSVGSQRRTSVDTLSMPPTHSWHVPYESAALFGITEVSNCPLPSLPFPLPLLLTTPFPKHYPLHRLQKRKIRSKTEAKNLIRTMQKWQCFHLSTQIGNETEFRFVSFRLELDNF
jgi:hypothetical protein